MTQNEDHVFVRHGEEFEIRLRTAPSSGHDWQLVSNPHGIELIADSYVRPVHEERSVGGAGTHVFRFRATAVGSFAVSFVLKRSWEKSAISSRVFQVNVSD